MKGHVKRTLDVLEALGFACDQDGSRQGKRIYRHPFDLDSPVKVWDGMSEAACIAVQRKANAIAETGHQGPAMPKTIGERNRILKDKSKLQRDRDAQARQQRIDRAERDYQQKSAIAAADRHRREIEDLMQPGTANSGL